MSSKRSKPSVKRGPSHATKNAPRRESDTQASSALTRQAPGNGNRDGNISTTRDRYMSRQSLAKGVEGNRHLMKPGAARAEKISLNMPVSEAEEGTSSQYVKEDVEPKPADDGNEEEYTSSDIIDGEDDEDNDSDSSSSEEDVSEDGPVVDRGSGTAVEKSVSEQLEPEGDESGQADDESEEADEVAIESDDGSKASVGMSTPQQQQHQQLESQGGEQVDDESEVADEVAVDSDEESGEGSQALSQHHRRPADSLEYELTGLADESDDIMSKDTPIAEVDLQMPLVDDSTAASDGDDMEDWNYEGLHTSADLAVLDYMSARIIETVMRASVVSSPMPPLRGTPVTPQRQQLGFLAREHVLFRRHHFTRSLFLGSSEQPKDEPDILRWIASMQRVNLATFLLLVFTPQVAIPESVSDTVPNRRCVVQSRGMGEAATGFFENIVPVNRRNTKAFELLVELQTQQWVLGALNEAELQRIVREQRAVSDVDLAVLLAVGEDSQEPEARDVDQYRAVLTQRLSKLSGSTLAGARALFGREAVLRQVAAFVEQCNDALPQPVLLCLGDAAHRDDVESAGEYTVDTSAAGRSSNSGSIEGDFEVAIVKPKEKPAPETSSSVGSIPGWQPNRDAASGFLETRKVASAIRQMSGDPFLNEVIKRAEPIHIEPISELPRDRQPGWTSTMLRELEQTRQKFNRTVCDPLPKVLRDLDQKPQEQGQLNLDKGDDDDEEEEEDVEVSEQDVPAVSPRSKYSLRSRQPQAGRSESISANPSARTLTKRSRQESPCGSDTLEATLDTVQRQPKRGRAPDYRHAQHDRAGTQFRGRRGIAAEDLSGGHEVLNPVGFTPSPPASPERSDAGNLANGSTAAANESGSEAPPRHGHYRPLKLAVHRAASLRQPRQTRRAHRQAISESDSSSEDLAVQRRRHQKQGYRYWTAEEEACFIQAVGEFGYKWTRILRHHGKDGIADQILRNRTTVNLKDKARDIKQKLQREGKPLGPFARASRRH